MTAGFPETQGSSVQRSQGQCLAETRPRDGAGVRSRLAGRGSGLARAPAADGLHRFLPDFLGFAAFAAWGCGSRGCRPRSGGFRLGLRLAPALPPAGPAGRTGRWCPPRTAWGPRPSRDCRPGACRGALARAAGSRGRRARRGSAPLTLRPWRPRWRRCGRPWTCPRRGDGPRSDGESRARAPAPARTRLPAGRRGREPSGPVPCRES